MAHEEGEPTNTVSESPTQSQRESTPSTIRPRNKSRHLSQSDGATTTCGKTQEQRLAHGLGWIGLGIGLAEIVAPHRMATMIGVSPVHRSLIRAMGLRELASSAGMFRDRTPATAVWSRVVGDVFDLALLSAAFASRRSKPGRLLATTTAVAGMMAIDLIAAQQLSRGVHTRNGTIPITNALIIDRQPQELYRHWRELAHLPQFMTHLVRVEVKDDQYSHWVAQGPAGSFIEWDAEITEDRPDERIVWRSVEGSEVDHAGTVRFEPATGGRGTIVTVDMLYRPSLGTVGAAMSAWLGKDPKQTLTMDLRRFKQVMEAGEVITTQGQPAGRAQSTSRKYDQAVR